MGMMETIAIAFLAAMFALVSSVINGLLSAEVRAWLPALTEKIVQKAVSMLPDAERERLDEEWRSHLAEIPGELYRVYVALGFMLAARTLQTTLARTQQGRKFSRSWGRLGNFCAFGALVAEMAWRVWHGDWPAVAMLELPLIFWSLQIGSTFERVAEQAERNQIEPAGK